METLEPERGTAITERETGGARAGARGRGGRSTGWRWMLRGSGSSWDPRATSPRWSRPSKELKERGIRFEVRVLSAHRDPEAVADYARNAHMRGLRVIIAAAGMSAALPGRRRRAHRPAGDRRPDQGQEHASATGSTRCCRRCRCRPASRSHAWPSTAPATPPCWPPGYWVAEPAPVISRYTRPEMALVWSEERKLEAWLAGRGRGLRGARRAGRGAGGRPRADQDARGRSSRKRCGSASA